MPLFDMTVEDDRRHSEIAMRMTCSKGARIEPGTMQWCASQTTRMSLYSAYVNIRLWLGFGENLNYPMGLF